jgi:hypothetical protein
VLLAHAAIIHLLWVRHARFAQREVAEFVSAPITLDLPPPEPEPAAPSQAPTASQPRPMPMPTLPPEDAGESQAITPSAPAARVDWPLEGKKAAEREVARELEAERIAKMFAGPQGTWASLTKRQRSKLSKFRWKPGVTGIEYDEKGNQIYHLNDGCVIVNSGFIACALGKVKVHGDMFENMREYFDEQRLPETDEGNGTEPEALRPPY